MVYKALHIFNFFELSWLLFYFYFLLWLAWSEARAKKKKNAIFMRTKLQKAAKPAAGFAAISSLGYPQPQLSIQLLPLVTCLRLAVVSLPERGVGVGVSFTLALP